MIELRRIDGSTRQEARQRAELAQLLRLRQWREDAARAVRDARAAERDAALARVQAGERRVTQLQGDIARLRSFVGGDGAAAMPQLAPYAAARRALLDDLFERAEYALIDERQAFDDAALALADAQAALLRASLHRDAMAQWQHETRRSHARLGEQRVERDAEPRQPGGPR